MNHPSPLWQAYKDRVMTKLPLPLSQENDLSVIRDRMGKCVSVPENAPFFVAAANFVNMVAMMDTAEPAIMAVEIHPKLTLEFLIEEAQKIVEKTK